MKVGHPCLSSYAGISAILKSLFLSPNETIIEALKYTAFPQDSTNLPYAGNWVLDCLIYPNQLIFLKCSIKYQTLIKSYSSSKFRIIRNSSPTDTNIPDGDFWHTFIR